MRFLGSVVVSGLVVCLAFVGCGLDNSGDADVFGDNGDDASASGSSGGSSGGSIDGANGSSSSSSSGAGSSSSGGSGGSSGSSSGGGSGSSSGGGSGSSSGVTDGGSSGADANPADTGVDSCGATEICNNGVDDDCDGKTDCDDPQCGPAQGWKCVPAAPSGWTLVTYEMNGHDTCETGYATPSPVVEGPSVPANSCACGACTVTDPGSCQKGTLTGSVDGLTSCSIGFSQPANDGQCTKFPAPPGTWTTKSGSKVKVNPVPWSGGACTVGQATAPTVTFAGQGETCALSAQTGSCASGATCAPVVAAPFAACVAQLGDHACPAGFTQKHTVGSNVHAGTPACNACNCAASGTCKNQKETVFTDSACGASGNNIATDLPVDGKCDDVNDNNGQTYSAYTYTADVDTTQCTPSGGGVGTEPQLDDVQTVCCAP